MKIHGGAHLKTRGQNCVSRWLAPILYIQDCIREQHISVHVSDGCTAPEVLLCCCACFMHVQCVHQKPVHDILRMLFQASFSLCYYPDSWKRSNTIVLHKPGKTDYTVAKSWRPIELLNCDLKILSWCVTDVPSIRLKNTLF